MKVLFKVHVHKEHVEFDEVVKTTEDVQYVRAYSKAQAVTLIGMRLGVFLIVRSNGFAVGEYVYNECSIDRYVVTIA